jgi:hypothetical protein
MLEVFYLVACTLSGSHRREAIMKVCLIVGEKNKRAAWLSHVMGVKSNLAKISTTPFIVFDCRLSRGLYGQMLYA